MLITTFRTFLKAVFNFLFTRKRLINKLHYNEERAPSGLNEPRSLLAQNKQIKPTKKFRWPKNTIRMS
jgi:hypothetical protein